MKYQLQTTQEKVLEGERLIKENEGIIYEDNSFEISGVNGSYHFENDVLTINITNKPWLASWSMIEEKIKQFFE
ncbi:unnamed protein product [marine sediment metagenome]|uniref:Scaffold protein Nfu/NifU N-terminal domain-containing protein n=2 Tax=marine sediment metagenome TaxID=412755 RepID=X1SIC4_9ZZZZ